MAKRFLIKHVGNLGDHIFFVPPILATLKKRYPDSHITLVTAWGFKDKYQGWGKRNQDGFCIAAMMTNPHIDQLVHYHDTALSLQATICCEEGQCFPTWSKKYFDEQKESDKYDGVFELDFGLKIEDNPIERLYEKIGLPEETYSLYQLYLTEEDRAIAQEVIQNAPRPRIVLLEALAGPTTRSWDPQKVVALERAIKKVYKVNPIWLGGRSVPEYNGRPLTLRQNIATAAYCDVGIGVLSGTLHLAAAVGLPTLTLYCDHPIHRAAPAYFLNRYIDDPRKKHRTLLGPSPTPMTIFKSPYPCSNLTTQEIKVQGFKNWLQPGKQSTKSCLSVITVDEVMNVLKEMLETS